MKKIKKHGVGNSCFEKKNTTLDKIALQLNVVQTAIKDLKEKSITVELFAEKFKCVENLLCRFESVINENEMLKKKTDILEKKLDVLEQQSLNNSIELCNVPVIENEIVFGTVKKIMKNGLDLELTQNDVYSCFRVNNFNSNLSDEAGNRNPKLNYIPNIIVKLKNQSLKEKILKAKSKNKQNLSTKIFEGDIAIATPVKPIFINECLTMFRRKLLAEANQFKKNLKFKFLWTRAGVILMKESEKGKTFVIRSLGDLERITHIK